MATAKIRAATAASPSELRPDLPRTADLSSGEGYSLSLVTSAQLSAKLQDAIYDLFDRNIGPSASTSSMAYQEHSKRSELFHSDARYFLLVRLSLSSSPRSRSPSRSPPRMPGALPNLKKRYRGDKDKAAQGMVDIASPQDLLGYLSFRFDTEETLSSRDAEVIYCYEVQLAPSVRGKGMGALLMSEFEDVGRRRGVDKGMLTCLKNNSSALGFYEKMGYEADEIDPTRMKEEEEDRDDEWDDLGEDEDAAARGEADYVILSKAFSPGAGG